MATDKKKPIELNTKLGDVAAGAATGALAGHFALGGDNKYKNGAIVGAAVVVLLPAIKSFTDGLMADDKKTA